MGLQRYRAKRDFGQSPEPAGGRPQSRPTPAPVPAPGPGRQFVIQKHAARRLHYDFRLELDGVLKSWALPKGVPLRQGDRRLAVAVEDHPLEYAKFEGIIPSGNYGAGTVMIWDQGSYQLVERKPDKLSIVLAGQKLRGRWSLVRMKKSETDWLLIKSEADAPPIPPERLDQSAVSGRSLEQIGADRTAYWHSAADLGDRPAAEPRFVVPMQARLVSELPRGEWLYEVKFDGVRAVAVKRAEQVQLYSRNEKDLAPRFGAIVAALARLPCAQAVLDGELVALDEEGRSRFQLLQPLIHGQGRVRDGPPLVYYLFDLLNLEGRDLTGLPLVKRKELLEALLPAGDAQLRYSASFEQAPAELLPAVERLGLEGLIGKQPQSRYEPGQRSGRWIKLKCDRQQEFVIGGYTPPQGTRQWFGSVVVGYYQQGQLLYASKVGTGFDEVLLRELFEQFQERRVRACPFANLPSPRGDRHGISPAQMRRCGWVRPELVCQVRYLEWTADGHLRHPVFLGLRSDKRAAEVVRES